MCTFLINTLCSHDGWNYDAILKSCSLSICIFSSSHLVLRSTSCLLLDMYITGEVEFGAVRGSVAPVYKRLDQSPPLDDKFMWLPCPTITEPSKT